MKGVEKWGSDYNPCTSIPRSFVCDKDIKVIKYLAQSKRDGFPATYNRGAIVDFDNQPMRPEENIPEKEIFRKMSINGFVHKKAFFIRGATHSYIVPPILDPEPGMIALATIKAGTKFYINDTLNALASEYLYVENKECTEEDIKDTRRQIAEIVAQECISKEEIGAGYILLSDKTCIHPLDYIKDKSQKAIGVVCEVRDGQAFATALDSYTKQWRKSTGGEPPCLFPYKEEEYCGKRMTIRINEQDEYSDEMYPATSVCLNYSTAGTEKGEWYLPSTYELSAMSRHQLLINSALILLGKDIVHMECHWSSCECDQWDAYYLSGAGSIIGRSYGKHDTMEVRPFIDINLKTE